MSRWPLIGRTAELEALAATQNGAAVVGGAGVGKTRLLAEHCKRREAGGDRVVHVSAASGTRDVPLGAFAPILANESLAAADPLELVVEVQRALIGRAKTGVVVAVDDAQHLDALSVAVLQQIAHAGSASVFITVRSGEPRPEGVTSLWAQGLVERIELAPLDRQHTAQLAALVQGDAPNPRVVDELWRLSEGNPLFVRELMLAGFGKHGVAASDRLQDIIDDRAARVGADVRPTLELLAVAECAVPIGVLEEDLLTELETHDLIETVAEDDRIMVNLAHPLYGEVLRARMPALVRSKRLATLVESSRRSELWRRTDVIQVARWELRSGGPIDPTAMASAAEAALDMFDADLAVELASAAVRYDAGVEAELTLACALCLTPEAPDGLARLVDLESRVTDERLRAEIISSRAFHDFFVAGQHEGGVERLEAAAAAVEDPVVAARLTAEAAGFRIYLGDFRSAYQRAAGVIADGHADDQTLVSSLATTTIVTAFTGRRERCERDAEHIGVITARGPFRGFDLNLIPASLALARVFAGDMVGGEDLIRRAQARAIDEGLPAVADALYRSLGPILVCRGEVEDAISGLERAAVAPGLTRTVPYGLASLALAQALQGLPDDAEATMRRYETLPEVGARLTRGVVQLAGAWVLVRRGAPSAAKARMREAAATSDRAGFSIYAAMALHDLVRLGDTSAVAELEQYADMTNEPWLPQWWVRHARALRDQDADALLAVAQELGDMGFHLYAAEAAAQARDLYRDQGEMAESLRADGVATQHFAHCTCSPTPALVSQPPVLTPRETEVARMAAGGMTSKQIADMLTVSLRTVDNHLGRVYAKLGIAGRHDLTPELLGDQ